MNEKKSQITWTTVWQLVSFIKPYWGWVALNIVVTLVSAGVDVLGGHFIKTFTDAALSSQHQTVFRQIIFIVVLVMVGIVIKYAVKYTSGRFSAYALRDIRNNATNRVSNLPFAEVETSHSGDRISRLTNDIAVMQEFFQLHFLNLIYQPIILLVACIYMARLNVRLLLLSITIIPLMVVLSNRGSRPTSAWVRDRQAGFGKINASVQDVIGGIYMVKAFNLGSVLYDQFTAAAFQVRDNELKLQRRIASLMPFLSIISTSIPVLSVAAYGGYLVIQGAMTPGSLFAFFYLFRFLTEPLPMLLYSILIEVRIAGGAAVRILEALDVPVERSTGTTFAAHPQKPIIQYTGVSFGYNDHDTVLNNITFGIEPGQTVALVGHSGSGKSTILKLLCGFYDPSAGSICLYDRPLEQWDLDAARQQLSLVPQGTYLFPTTIATNIAHGKQGASLEQIMAAARAANVHEFIIHLPNGYDTLVGERGNRLSGGQRQRIEIARAILKNAPILLLDEPTSALDNQSEALVQKALERLMADRTVLVIAHRLSTIKRADEILVLDRGQIIQRGSHQELLEQGGVYQQLYLKQFQT